MTQHTPGIWTTTNVGRDDYRPPVCLISADRVIAEVYCYEDFGAVMDETGLANAKLIAAAPELLAAAKAVIEGCQNSDGTLSRTSRVSALADLKDAIAKATD